MLPATHYIWIHCANQELGDFMIPYVSYNDALAFASSFVQMQPDHIFLIEYNKDGSVEVGGSPSLQVAIVGVNYVPVHGWDAWSDTYLTITEAEALGMSESEAFNI